MATLKLECFADSDRGNFKKNLTFLGNSHPKLLKKSATFRQWTIPQLVPMLFQQAGKVDLRRFKKTSSGAVKREKDEINPHVSTARILAKRKKRKKQTVNRY
jgi:hypothetical protein